MPTSFVNHLYLPLMRQINAPDLSIRAIVTTNSVLKVIIENRGSLTVQDALWVDVYVRSQTAPTKVNQRWRNVGEEGLVWGISAVLIKPGDALTLSIDDAYYMRGYSRLIGPIKPGTQLYAQVDSYNETTKYGSVLEADEIIADAYNNIASTTAASWIPVPSYPSPTAVPHNLVVPLPTSFPLP